MGNESVPNDTGRLQYIDVLNVLAAFSVVMLHCNGVFWGGPAVGHRTWYSANFIETFFYWAVPIFFMISGVTLMDYRERMDTKTYFSHRIKKTVVPYLIWTFIAIVYLALKDSNPEALTIRSYIENLLSPSAMSIYWFFPPLFGVYFSIPILSAISPRHEVFRYIIICGLIGAAALPLVFSLFGFTMNWSFIPIAASGHTLYAVIGYELAHAQFTDEQKTGLYILGILGFLMQFIGVQVLSTPDGVSRVFKGYLNLPALLQSIAVFVFVKQFVEAHRNDRLERMARQLSSTTFGVYLIHYYFVRDVPGVLNISVGSMAWRTLGALCIFCISAAITWLAHRTKVGRVMLP